jgi:hypothetical protein
MKKMRWVAVWVGMMAGTVAQGDLVYQSDFTGADLASAGLDFEQFDPSSNWILNTTDDRAQVSFGAGNDRASLYTTDSWQSDDGFTLDVTFNQISAGVRFSFGMVDAAAGVSTGSDWLNSGLSGRYGIGLATQGEMAGGGDALAFNNGSGSSVLSTAQGDITFNALQTLSITVKPDSWSYRLNGAPSTTGLMTFDTIRSYRFIAFAQKSNAANLNGSYFSNITITAIPEPATAGMLGFGIALMFFLRRRLSC